MGALKTFRAPRSLDEAAEILRAGNVTVQCIEVKEQSVILQIAGESAPTELYIETRSQ